MTSLKNIDLKVKDDENDTNNKQVGGKVKKVKSKMIVTEVKGAKKASKKASKKDSSKKSSKKASKKASSKKSSKKGSKKLSSKKASKIPEVARVDVNEIEFMPDPLFGGVKKSSKKASKKASSKKSSKKGSKKASKKGSKQKRTLPPALSESNLTNKKISQATGVGISPALMKFVKKFREMAKKNIKDDKDFMAINKKTVELFNEYLNKIGKAKVVAEIEGIAADIKKERASKKK